MKTLPKADVTQTIAVDSALSIIVVVGATLLQALLGFFFQGASAAIIFLLGIMIAANLRGLWTGIFTTAISALLLYLASADFLYFDLNKFIVGGSNQALAARSAELLVIFGTVTSLLIPLLNKGKPIAAANRNEAAEQSIQALSERDAFLRLVIDATPSMIFVKDWEGRFVLANEALARCYGTTISAILGKTDADFNSNRDELEHFRRLDREVISSRSQRLIAEEPVTQADGQVRWFSTVKVPLINQDGTCSKLLGVATDITDRKNIEEALQQADRKKDEFLAILAHELRNPMAAISAAALLLSRPAITNEQFQLATGALTKRVRQLSKIVDDLLDISRIVRGKVQLEMRPLDLAAVLSSAADAARPLFEEQQQSFEVHVPPNLPVVGDSTRLEQIFSNLLTNAARYTGERGHIIVTAKIENRNAVVRIKDDGAGIPASFISHVFELFTQGDSLPHRAKAGLGIGLALVKKLTELHGGRVAVESAGLGKGSEFTVSLPVAAAQHEETERPPREQARVSGLRILLVEDNTDTALMMAAALELEGHQIKTASDGRAAIHVALTEHPDAILLDIGLPGLDGYEVAKTLRARGLVNALIIAVTGYGQERDVERSRRSGIDYHLLKPVDYVKLAPILSQHCNKGRMALEDQAGAQAIH